MIAPAAIRRRIIQGDTYRVIAADIGCTPDALRKRARRLGVHATAVLGWHRGRRGLTVDELASRKTRKAS